VQVWGQPHSLHHSSAGALLGDMLFQNVGLSPNYTALQPKRPYNTTSYIVIVFPEKGNSYTPVKKFLLLWTRKVQFTNIRNWILLRIG
jgi:hypothetical protein